MTRKKLLGGETSRDHLGGVMASQAQPATYEVFGGWGIIEI